MRIQLITSCVNQFGEYEYFAKIVIDDSKKIVIGSGNVVGKTTVKRELGLYGADVVEEYELDEETTEEVRYYVRVKVPTYLQNLMGEGSVYLNYSSIDNDYFLSDKDDVGAYVQTSFTRDEIEEFGIAHPEVRREDLEFIEVVE